MRGEVTIESSVFVGGHLHKTQYRISKFLRPSASLILISISLSVLGVRKSRRSGFVDPFTFKLHKTKLLLYSVVMTFGFTFM